MSSADNLPKPLLKWAGGKRQLLPQYDALFPQSFGAYHEPFLGGGAVYFYLRPARAFLSDLNSEVMNVYDVVRDALDALIPLLRQHRNEPGYYYAIRAQDPAALSPVEQASRTIFLNRTCYNGLYRVNRKGQFNVPFGRYRNPQYCDESALKAASELLQGAVLSAVDFEAALEHAKPGDFVYLDPPYQPLSATASFVDYTTARFDEAQQVRLASAFRKLTKRGVQAMLSNSDTGLVRELYHKMRVVEVSARRAINSVAEARGDITELVIRNY